MNNFKDKKWVEVNDQDTSVMKPVTDFSSPEKSMKSVDFKNIKWKEGADYITGEFLDISQTIGDIKKQSDTADKKYLISEEAKKNRLTEIEQEINLEKEKLRKISSQPLSQSPMGPGRDIQRRADVSEATKNIKELSKEKNRISAELKPSTPEERSDVLENSGFDSDSKISTYDMIQKYGPRHNRIWTDAISEKMDIPRKEKAKGQNLEDILSYSNIVYGEKPKLKHTSDEAVSKLWDEITTDPGYYKKDYQDKRKFMDKKVSEFISTLDLKTAEGQDPVDTKALKNRILANLLPKFAQGKDGNPTIEGTKLYLEDQLGEVSTMIEFLQQSLIDAGLNPRNIALTDETDANQFRVLSAKHGGKNVDTWYFNTQKELIELRKTQKELDRLLKMPEHKGQLRNIGKAIQTTDARNIITLGIKDMVKAFQITGSAKKISEGIPLNYAEQKQMETFATLNFINNLDIEGLGFKAATGIINMIPYIASFVYSGGAYAGVKAAVLAGTRGMTKGFATKAIKIGAKKYTMAELGARALGSAAQTTVVPQMYLKNITDYARDNVQLVTDPELNKLTASVELGTGKPIGKAIARGLWDAYSEMFTERTGAHIMAGLGKAGKFAGKIKGTQMLKNTALAGFMETKGIKTVAELATRFEKAAGWNGIMEEYMEEFVNYYMSGIADPKNLKGPGSKDWWSDQFVTFLTVAGFSGMVMKPLQIGMQQTIGKNIKFTGKYEDGKAFDVKIPRVLYNEISNVFSETKGFIGEAGSRKLDEILTKWEGKLTKEQETFVISQILSLGQEKVNQAIVEQTTDKSFLDQITEGVNVVPPSDKLQQDQILSMPPEERKEIEDENKRIEGLHPELAKNNLLVRDPGSGQILDPDKQTTKQLLMQVNKRISEEVEFDSRGNPTKLTPETIQLINQQGILEDYSRRFIDREKPFEDLHVAEKNELLQADLTEGKELVGTTSYINTSTFEVKLDDGRIVKAFYDANLDSKTREKVNEAIKKNKPISLVLNPWENWNPDLSITDFRSGVEIPYLDKIDITLDGEVIGSVQIADSREEKSKKHLLEQREIEAKRKVGDTLANLAKEIVKEKFVAEPINDIERRRQEAYRHISKVPSPSEYYDVIDLYYVKYENIPTTTFETIEEVKELINAKYDAELTELEEGPTEEELDEIKRKRKGRIEEIERLKIAKLTKDGKEKEIGTSRHDYEAGLQREIDKREKEVVKYDLEIREADALSKLKTAGAKLAKEIVKKTGGLKEAYSAEEKEMLLQAILDAVKAMGDYAAIQIEKLIETLREAIRNTEGMSEDEKNAYYSILDDTDNQKKIIDYYSKLQLHKKGFIKKEPILSLSDLVLPEFEGINVTGAQKVDAFRNGYAPAWRTIADLAESSKDNVETIFYKIARTKRFNNEVANEAQYRHFVSTLKGKDFITDKIAEMLEKSNFSSAVSLFNFYSNVQVTKQFGFIKQGNRINKKLLNPPERYDEFVDSFWNAVRRYSYGKYTGEDAIKEGIYRKLTDHKDERDLLFNTYGNKSYSWYESQTPEKREELRRTQHQKDILLLSELSGIPTDIWQDYFSEQTKETFAKMTRDAVSDTNFGTYDNLLKQDTYRGNYNRIQSDIAFNLIDLLRKYPVQTEFEENFIRYFTQGNEDTGALSNLYKLSTATKDKDDISLRGVDIKGDRFSSMIQDNMLFVLAEKIRSLPISNNLTRFYFERQKDAEISMLNGIHNTEENADKKGTPALNMSFEDLWVSQLYEFLQDGDSYHAWMGQFGDKPALEFIEAPKHLLPEANSDQWKSFISENPGFEDAVQWVLGEFINHNQSLFNLFLPSIPSGLTDKEKVERTRRARLDMARSFVYNFNQNTKDIIEVFHGDIAAYEDDLTAIVKRGGSSSSPGYHMNTNVEGGVGETYQFALVEDFEEFDGVEFMTGEYAARAQISLGSSLSKINEPGMEFLSSIKALHTNINPDNNLRGLTKGNIINIDLIASVLPESKYGDIQAFMKKNKIDRLSFTSTTKLYEYAKGKAAKAAIAIQLWDKEGNKLSKPIIPENSIITRNTIDTYIQQDLRHSTKPKSKKMSSQLLANMLILPNGRVIAKLLNSMQKITIADMKTEFNDKRIDQAKLEWLKKNVNQNTQTDIHRLLEMGMTPYEPSLANFMRKMVASQVTRKALEIPINRVTTQEIPDPQGLLDVRRATKDGLHILLPDIAANIDGARYAEFDFIGKTHKDKEGNTVFDAIDHVKMNREKYRDLFDMNGNLQEWEITDRDGEIPGEFIISTRTPADDLHAHTVGRLKYKLTGGNFTMLDRESRESSGSDFDGDQRFNWVFYKNKNGKIILNSTKEGIANQIMMEIAQGYMDPSMDAKITEPINTKMYDDLVNKLRQEQASYSYLDPRAHNQAREENMTGVRMKGIMTDVVTTYSIINNKGIPFKKTIILPYEGKIPEGFLGYIGGFENKGKGTPKGDGKDKAMRLVADSAIGEMEGGRRETSTSQTMQTFMDERWDYYPEKQDAVTSMSSYPKIVMLARNGSLKNKSLLNQTKEYIKKAADNDVNFIVGDMPGVDSQFIDYLQEIGAKFTIYHTGKESRITFDEKQTISISKNINLTGIVRDPKGLMKIHLANMLNMAFDNPTDPKIEIMGLNEITAMMFVISMFSDESVDITSHKSIHDHIAKVSAYFTSPLVRDFVTMMRRDNGGLRSTNIKAIKDILGQKYNADDVKRLLDFHTYAKELSEVRRFYALTQKAPNTTVELQSDKQLYEKVKNNQFNFLDVKNLFDKTGHPIKEFAIVEDVLQLAEDYIYVDTFEYSAAGREIYKAIYSELKRKDKSRKYLTTDELKSLSYGMNAIAAIRAVGNKQTMESLYKELLGGLKSYKEKYPNNTFLQTIGKVKRGGNNYLEILTDRKRGTISEVKLAKMREDFDSLASADPRLADKFVAYAFLRWGPVTSTWRGSYYNLVGDNYRVLLSKKMQNELYEWQTNNLSQTEKLQITEWIMRNSRQKVFKEMSAVNPDMSSYYDYNAMATIDPSISYDTISGIEDISSNEDFIEYAKQHDFDAKTLTDYAESKIQSRKVKAWARVAIEHFNTKAKRLFPVDISSDLTIKDMMPFNAIGEILASEDPVLQNFVMGHLQKMYPGVRIFTSHDAFVDFVTKFGGRGFNVDPEAIGHAFANAVYIDPARAKQSTMFHEHSHIYWDALPVDNATKMKLRELFREQYTFGTEEDIDEEIILAIGRAGIDIADTKLKGNLYERFVQLLKQFWIDVKNMFGVAGRGDLVNKLAWRIWNNSDRIVPSTNYSAALLRNMVTFNNKEENASFNGDTHTHFIGKDAIPSVTTVIASAQDTKFNVDVKSKAIADKFNIEYQAITREKLSKQHLDDIATREMKLWSDTAEKGTVIHAITESVFGERVVTDEEKAEFEDINVFYKLVNSIRKLKEHYEKIHPQIIWYTEQHLVSKKYKIGGLVDLVGDIGNDELIVFDFKTTDKELANESMLPLEEYKRAYSLFKPPFQTLPQSKYSTHMLQTNIYSNMLEEQEDPNQPGKKNRVTRIRIIPIIRDIKDGKIVTATLADNHVSIPRNEKTTEIAERMMLQNYSLREDFSTVYPEFRFNLEKSGMAPQLITSTLVAYNFMKQAVPDLRDMTREHMEGIRGEEFGALKMKLINLGFKSADLYGPNAIPFEFLFYNVVKNSLNFERKQFLELMDTYFPEQEVSAKYNAILNPDASERTWSHITHNNTEYYLEEVGYDTVSIDDEIMMIYDIKRPAGEMPRDVYFYTVQGFNKKKKTITVKNQITGDVSIILIPDGKSGALRIHSELPAGIEDPGKESFVSRYNYEKEATYERHVDFNKISEKQGDVERSEAEETNRRYSIRKIQAFFNEVPTLAEAEVWANDFNKVDHLYHELRVIDDNISGLLANFIREVSTNHLFANAIARENNFEGVPKQPLPITLNTYFLLTGHPDAIWKSWDNMENLRFAMPQGLIEGHYVPTSLFTTLAEYGNRNYDEEKYLLDRTMERFNDKVDYESAIMTTEDGEKYWRTPDEAALIGDEESSQFLEVLYDYYERLDPVVAMNKENGIRRRLPIANVYFTREEAIERFGSKWGQALYERLKPAAYDSMKLTIMEYDKEGNLVEAKDKLGNTTIKTLGDIKQDFALEHMNEEQLKQYLGSKWRHIIPRILGTVTVAGQSGLLNHYIKTANNIFKGKRDANNIGTVLRSNKKNIPVIGHGRSNYSMGNLVAAETKAIDSMLFRHHMKHLMAPLDWMINMYEKNKNQSTVAITKYLKTWGEYILYKKKPDEDMFGGETTSNVIDVANRMNSYNKIMFGITGQLMNFAIGQGFDLIREPAAYKKGLERLFFNDKSLNFMGFKKAWNLAKRFGLANIVDDTVFDQIEKEYRIAGYDVKKVENVGYKLMELAEKGNQFPIMIGLMTDAEWNSYDNNAEVIDKINKLTEWRKGMIIYRVQAIHGHYSNISMAPWYVTNLGKAGMQFRKWLPTYIWSQIAPYHIDKNLIVRSGVLPAMHLLGKRIRYNRKSIQERQDLLEKITEGKKETDDEFFRTTDEYFNTLIEEFNGNKISFSDLSASDRKNLTYALGHLAMIVGANLLLMLLIGGADDPTKYKKFGLRNFIPLLKRFQGDILWLYSSENWMYFVDNIIPAMSMLVNGTKLVLDISKYMKALVDPSALPKAVYMKDTIIAEKGTPKFLISFTYVLPGGSGMRFVIEKANIQKRKHQMIDLKELGMKQSEIDELGLESSSLSRFEIDELAFQYGKFYQNMILAAEYDALMDKKYNPGIYFDLILGRDLILQERGQLSDALKMIKLNQMMEDGEFVDTAREMNRKAKEMIRYKARRAGRSKKHIRKEFTESLNEK